MEEQEKDKPFEAQEPEVAYQSRPTVFTPTQQQLLRMFAFDSSEETLNEVKIVLSEHFRKKAEAELDRLWDEGILNQEKLDEINEMDLHNSSKLCKG